MLDILRSTSETKDIKVIMMTALSSEDQRQRGEQMGSDRYLVKSQVGIEDVVRVVHEVLGDSPAAAPAAAPGVAPATPVAAPAPPAVPAQPAPMQQPRPQQPIAVPPRPATAQQIPIAPIAPAQAPAVPVMPPQPGNGAAPIQPPPPPQQTAQTSLTSPSAPSARQRTIQPISAPSTKVDINELLDRELAKEAGINLDNRPPVETTTQEKTEVQNQLNAYQARPVNGPAPAPMQPGQPHAVTNLAPLQMPPSPALGPNPIATPPPTGLPPQPPVQ